MVIPVIVSYHSDYVILCNIRRKELILAVSDILLLR